MFFFFKWDENKMLNISFYLKTSKENYFPCAHAEPHLFRDRGDTLATWLYRHQDLEEKDPSVNQSLNDPSVCRTVPTRLGLLNKDSTFPFILYALNQCWECY